MARPVRVMSALQMCIRDSQWTWVGFDNYVKAFSDSSFLHAFWYTALFALVSVAFINVLAFTVAYFLTKGIKGSNLFLSLIHI